VLRRATSYKAIATRGIAESALRAEVGNGLRWVVATRAVRGAAQRNRCLVATRGSRRASECTTPEAAALVAWGRQALDVAVAGGRVATEARGAEVRDGLARVVAARAARRAAQGGGSLAAADGVRRAEEGAARDGAGEPAEVADHEASLEEHEPEESRDASHRRLPQEAANPTPPLRTPSTCPSTETA